MRCSSSCSLAWLHCRLPAATSQSQRLEVVANAIAVLGLGDVRHSIIGDEEVRGTAAQLQQHEKYHMVCSSALAVNTLSQQAMCMPSSASKGVCVWCDSADG